MHFNSTADSYLGKNCHNPFPSYPELAKKLGCTPKTAYRFRIELTKAGLIAHKKQSFKNGKRGPNLYSFPMDMQVPANGHTGPKPMDTSVHISSNQAKEYHMKEKYMVFSPRKLAASQH
jgi:hypothetical protein